MAFRRTHELWTYDVFPKVFETGKEAEIHIHYMGGRKSMSPEQTYEATVMWMSGSNGNYPATEYKRIVPFNGTEEGSFTGSRTDITPMSISGIAGGSLKPCAKDTREISTSSAESSSGSPI